MKPLEGQWIPASNTSISYFNEEDKHDRTIKEKYKKSKLLAIFAATLFIIIYLIISATIKVLLDLSLIFSAIFGLPMFIWAHMIYDYTLTLMLDKQSNIK